MIRKLPLPAILFPTLYLTFVCCVLTRGANNVLLKIGQLEGLPEHIPRLCSLALSKQKHRITQ